LELPAKFLKDNLAEILLEIGCGLGCHAGTDRKVLVSLSLSPEWQADADGFRGEAYDSGFFAPIFS
jgi:hypothetical protein